MVKEDLKELLIDVRDKITKEVLNQIPGLASFLSVKKIFTGVQDYFLIKKVYAFLFELSSMPLESRVTLVEKINADPIYGQQFGIFLILALDRHEFEQKAIMLARICKYYEMKVLSKSTFVGAVCVGMSADKNFHSTTTLSLNRLIYWCTLPWN